MRKDERSILEVLRGELEFLERGGYARAPGTSWRPVFMFEDSPICMNHDYDVNPAWCGDCALTELIPPEFRLAKFPCRHIPLNTVGETLDSLYRYADEHEIEETVRKWLRATIAHLEGQRETELRETCEATSPSSGGQPGTALHENAKCANPACPVSFDWRKGGKFFRFSESPNQAGQHGVNKPPAGIHGVRHFWLCERCSHILSLVYEEDRGVDLRISSREFATDHSERELPA